MPENSFFQIDIPATDILTWLFPPGIVPSDKSIWIDAEHSNSQSLSPRQLLHWVKRLGIGLYNLGLNIGDTVLILSSNHIFVPVAYLGIAGHGYVFSGCNPAYGPSETCHQMQNSEAKIMLVDPELLPTALEAAKGIGFPTDQIFLFSDEECPVTNGIHDWRRLLGSFAEAEAWQWRRFGAEEAKTRTAVLNYSSGTTGLPKGVQISHQNVIANVEQSLYMRRLKTASSESIQSAAFPEQERWLGFLPLYHAYGQLWSISAAARSLTPVYFMRGFNYQQWLSHVAKHKITHIQTAPPLLVMLGKRSETQEFDLSSLKNILCGAAPLSKELQNEVMSKVGEDLRVVQTWGMTELTCSCLHVPGLMTDTSGSAGLIDPNCEMKLVSDDGREVGDDERGEIHVRGPNVCLGYWRNEEATRNTFDHEGFLKTGDVAVRRNGWYWIVDRKKELIKVKGFQVAPAELEAILLRNDHIADAAVVGMTFDHEEQPRAYVALKEHAKTKVKADDIVEWVADRVARHKHLTGGVSFVDEVPKSPSGKIQTKVMRDWASRDAKHIQKMIRAKL